MSRPDEPVPIPVVVAAIAGGRQVKPVWVNELGGVTFEIGTGARREFVKSTPPASAHLLVAEAERLRWAAAYVRVPRVLGSGPGWLHTAGLPGRSAVDPRWVAEPRTAVRAIGAGLRLLHDRMPVAQCPFGPPDWVTAAGADLVVSHGDACAPNTLVCDDGSCCGHVDLSDLGVADRWADLAIAMLSLPWNYTGDHGDDLLDAYGVEPDRARIALYQRQWQAGGTPAD